MKNKPFFVNIYPTNDRRATIDYASLLKEHAIHSKECGFAHTLVTVGDKRIDPWIISQAGLSGFDSFNPIVAVNPLYVHPVEVAKKVVALQKLYGKTVSLNLVTGSFFNEMKSLGDNLSLEERSQRLKDFHLVLSELLNGKSVTIQSKYYSLAGAEIYPKMDKAEIKYFVSGTLTDHFKDNASAYFLRNIKPLNSMPPAATQNSGLALGICARKSREEAIEAVKKVYPDDRKGSMLFEMSLANKETPWNEWLRENLPKHENDFSYYLNPMKNYWSAAPFVVDSYEEIAKYIQNYHKLGYSFFVMDYLPEEAPHIKEVLKIFNSII